MHLPLELFFRRLSAFFSHQKHGCSTGMFFAISRQKKNCKRLFGFLRQIEKICRFAGGGYAASEGSLALDCSFCLLRDARCRTIGREIIAKKGASGENQSKKTSGRIADRRSDFCVWLIRRQATDLRKRLSEIEKRAAPMSASFTNGFHMASIPAPRNRMPWVMLTKWVVGANCMTF